MSYPRLDVAASFLEGVSSDNTFLPLLGEGVVPLERLEEIVVSASRGLRG